MPDWKMFSSDDHVDLPFLPGDLWQKRVPAAYRDRAPRLVETATDLHWEMDGALLGSPQQKNGVVTTTFGHWGTPVEHEVGKWRPTTPELRLADMDRDGVEGQVLYGGLTRGFGGKDPDLNSMVTRAYNEWTSEFCSAAPDRLIGLGWVPTHGVEAAIDELYNCARLGLKGVQFQAFMAEKKIWDAVWEPLWDAAEDTGLPVSLSRRRRSVEHPRRETPGARRPDHFHNGSADSARRGARFGGHVGDPASPPKAQGGTGRKFHRLDSLCCRSDGLGVRGPDEQGQGGDAAVLDMLPSDYYRRQVYATFQTDPIGIKLLEDVGVDNALWASDYPHGDSIWPRSHETVQKDFAQVDEALVRKVTRDNGMKLYLGEE